MGVEIWEPHHYALTGRESLFGEYSIGRTIAHFLIRKSDLCVRSTEYCPDFGMLKRVDGGEVGSRSRIGIANEITPFLGRTRLIPEVMEEDDLQLVTSGKRHLCMILTRRGCCNGRSRTRTLRDG